MKQGQMTQLNWWEMDGSCMDRSRVGHVWVMDGSSPLHLLQDVMQRHGLVILNLLELAGKVS